MSKEEEIKKHRDDKEIEKLKIMFDTVSSLPIGDERDKQLLTIVDYMYHNIVYSSDNDGEFPTQIRNFCIDKISEYRDELLIMKANNFKI